MIAIFTAGHTTSRQCPFVEGNRDCTAFKCFYRFRIARIADRPLAGYLEAAGLCSSAR